jgi:hypothetical protein
LIRTDYCTAHLFVAQENAVLALTIWVSIVIVVLVGAMVIDLPQ